MKAPIYLDAVFITEAMQEPQFNLEEKDNSRILKLDFSSTADSHIFTSIAPELLYWSH